MEPIKRIVIKNFQKHKSLKLNLSPRITTITGSTDTGKSSIIRALRLVATNQPTGDRYITHHKKECSVSVKSGKNKTTRKRGKQNIYQVNKEKFTSFRNGVPDRVTEVLKMTGLNFQNQHDPSFWLSASASEVSTRLNQIINLDIIDRSMSYLSSEKRKCSSRVSVTEERLQETEKELKELSFVDTMEKKLRLLEKTQKKLNDKITTKKSLEKMVSRIKRASRRKNKYKRIVESGDKSQNKYDKFSMVQGKINRLKSEIEEMRKLSSTLNKTPRSLPQELNTLSIQLRKARKRRSDLFLLIKEMKQSFNNTLSKRSKMKKLKKKASELQKGECPLCGK